MFYLSVYICACSKSQGIGEEEWVEVTHDYTAQKDDELTLRVGDTIKGLTGGLSDWELISLNIWFIIIHTYPMNAFTE